VRPVEGRREEKAPGVTAHESRGINKQGWSEKIEDRSGGLRSGRKLYKGLRGCLGDGNKKAPERGGDRRGRERRKRRDLDTRKITLLGEWGRRGNTEGIYLC